MFGRRCEYCGVELSAYINDLLCFSCKRVKEKNQDLKFAEELKVIRAREAAEDRDRFLGTHSATICTTRYEDHSRGRGLSIFNTRMDLVSKMQRKRTKVLDATSITALLDAQDDGGSE